MKGETLPCVDKCGAVSILIMPGNERTKRIKMRSVVSIRIDEEGCIVCCRCSLARDMPDLTCELVTRQLATRRRRGSLGPVHD